MLRTGERLLAEATANDAIWGIGLNVGDSRVQTPSRWPGTNILGWALMEARTALRLRAPAAPAEEPPAAAAGAAAADTEQLKMPADEIT